MAYKRILTIQDISCVGQCSMTVAMPILSACGHETCILPTAVLSTHTGGFGRPAVVHLQDLDKFPDHWSGCDISFDAIYTGYLGSVAAVETAVSVAARLLAPGGKLIVDPAMADHGKRYSGLDENYADAMAALCAKADILLPNVTEAAMLTGRQYREELTQAYVRQLLKELPQKTVVLTGVGFAPGCTGVAIREGENCVHIPHPKLERSFHGTGDMFAAAFVGAVMQGKSAHRAAEIASGFVLKSIQLTDQSPAHWYGVRFEPYLGELSRMVLE